MTCLYLDQPAAMMGALLPGKLPQHRRFRYHPRFYHPEQEPRPGMGSRPPRRPDGQRGMIRLMLLASLLVLLLYLMGVL